MKMNFGERLVALSLLPQEGNFLTLRIVRSAKEKLAPSEEEVKLFKVIQDGERIQWDAIEGAKEHEIALSEKEFDLVVEALKKLDTGNKLEERHIPLYEKFIEAPALEKLAGDKVVPFAAKGSGSNPTAN